MIQRWLAEHCHRVVYRAWLPQALLNGQIETDRRIAQELHAVAWNPRGWKWVDPSSDLEALEMEIKLGINSRQRACAERGVDFEDVIDELQYEETYAAELEVDISGADSVAAPAERKRLPPGRTDDNEAEARRLAVVTG